MVDMGVKWSVFDCSCRVKERGVHMCGVVGKRVCTRTRVHVQYENRQRMSFLCTVLQIVVSMCRVNELR